MNRESVPAGFTGGGKFFAGTNVGLYRIQTNIVLSAAFGTDDNHPNPPFSAL
jgi:hypothetical protein